MAKRDYYEVLSVDRGTGAAEIKAAYRKLAIKFHPDRNPGDAPAEDRFKEASEDYEVLSDGEKRSRYDRFRHHCQHRAVSACFDPSINPDVSDILDHLFGSGYANRRVV